jgi:hypothetical protein
VITSGQKFECVYGAGSKGMFDRLLGELRRILAEARAKHEPLTSEGLPEVFRIEPVGTLRTQMPSESLDRMLRDGTVPMEEDEPTGKQRRFASRQSEDVVKDVLDRVRLRVGFDAERFIREDFFGDQVHQVGVNLVTDVAAGVVASGWYSTSDRIQLEFLLSASKLETYVAATRRERSKSALFFMRPTNEYGLTQAVWKDIERRLDDLEWQLVQQQVRVVTLSDAEQMAAEVADWAASVR